MGSMVKIHGHVFSLIGPETDKAADSHTSNAKCKNSTHCVVESAPSGLIHKHKWGTSSCIIPRREQQDLTTSPVVEFGLNHCIKKEVTSSNLVSLLLFYPFSSFVLRFQLWLFFVMNWLRGDSAVKDERYSNKPCHSLHMRKLSALEILDEALKVGFGGVCFMLAAMWSLAKQCRRTRADQAPETMVKSISRDRCRAMR